LAKPFIGTSGWVYKHWVGILYPEKLASGEHLDLYAERFSTVELNYSYYQLPPRSSFEKWRAQAPPGFVFAVKASRYLTHLKKLKDPAEPLQRLMDNAGGLEEKLGPVLFQFPRWWTLKLERLGEFFEALQAHPGHRYAFEFRHASWLVPEVYALLERHDAALCLPLGWGLPVDVRLTADWSYIRFHGGEHGVGFTESELQSWAERTRGFLARGADTYAYFNNDPDGHAIFDATRLKELLGV
jgi:uncharacterized protein YecE (DUF72 family)